MVMLSLSIMWFKEGDVNFKFFYMYVSYRKSKNLVIKMVDGGRILMNYNEKVSVVDDFYFIFIGQCGSSESMTDLEVFGLLKYELFVFDFFFLEYEGIISELFLNKVLCLNGFTGRFYKVCWSIIKDDIMVVLGVIWSS